MTNHREPTLQEGRAAAIDLGPYSEVPESELARQRERAGVISPGPASEVPESELARQRHVAGVISPGNPVPDAELGDAADAVAETGS